MNKSVRTYVQDERIYREVRSLIDTGSLRSYILRTTEKQLRYKPKRI